MPWLGVEGPVDTSLPGDLSGNHNPVEIKLFGSDQRALEQTDRAANQLIAHIPGIVDNFDGITPVGPTYQIAVDERRANLAGTDRLRWPAPMADRSTSSTAAAAGAS